MTSDRIPEERSRVLGRRFQLMEILGCGLSGTTWLAKDLERGDRCAVKVFESSGVPGWRRERFRAEARALAKVLHPNVARFRAVVLDPGPDLAALAMDLVEGTTLLAFAGQGAVPSEDVLAIAVACARGLAALHAAGVVHGDLQPRNVVVTGTPGSRSAVLLDVGLGLGGVRPSRGDLTGTIGFAAPESVLDAEFDARSDLYGLGALLYFLLAGEPPLEPRAILDALARGEDPFAQAEARARESLPSPFGLILGRLLVRHPAARLQHAAEVIEAVNEHFGRRIPAETVETRAPALARPALAGRTAERRRLLRGVLSGLEGGRGCVVVLQGPEGSGRTRMLEDLRRTMEFRGRAVLAVRPGGSEDLPLGALRRAMRGLDRGFPTDATDAAMPPAAVIKAHDEGAVARTSAAALDTLRRAVASSEPPLLLLDDPLDIDGSSLAFMFRFLSDAVDTGHRPVIVATLPEEMPEDLPPAAEALRRRVLRVASDVIPLGALSPQAADELIRGLLPLPELSGSVLARIRESTGCLPGALVETAMALLEGGRVVYRPGGWVLLRPDQPLPVPGGLAETLRVRLARLPPASIAAFRALSLAGGAVTRGSWGTIARTTLISEREESQLFEAGLLKADPEGTGVSLGSASLRSVVAEGITDADRARWGEVLARIEEMAGRNSSPSAVRHLLAAGNRKEAISRGPAAIGALRARHRFEEGRELAHALLDVARREGTEGSLVPLLDEAAALELQRKRGPEAMAFVEEGLGMAREPGERRSLLLRLCDLQAARGMPPSRALADLRCLAPGPEEEARALLSLAQAHGIARNWDDARRALVEARGLACNCPAVLVRVFNGLAIAAIGKGDHDEAREHYRHAIEVARSIGNLSSAFVVRMNLARLEVRQGRPRRALRLSTEALEGLGPGVGLADETALLLVRTAAFEGLCRWRAARDTAARAATLAEEAGSQEQYANALLRKGQAEALLGRHEEALRTLTRALQAATDAASRREAETARLVLGLILLERGEMEGVRGVLADLEGTNARGYPIDVLRSLAGLSGKTPEDALAEVSALLGRPEVASWPGEAAALREAEAKVLLRVDVDAGHAAALALVRERRSAKDADGWARALVLLGTACAHQSREGASRTLARAHRLARRLENVLVRAEILEACGRNLLGRPETREEGRRCLAEAASLYGAASLSGRACQVETELADRPGPSEWTGLRPEKMAWVLAQTRKVNEAEDPESVLAALLDAAIGLTGAERGFLVTTGPEGLTVKVARSFGAKDVGDPEHTISTSIVESVVREGRSTTTTDASEDPRFAAYFSVRNLQLRSVLAVPIRRGSRVLGAFYLDNRLLAGVFRDEDRIALEMLAEQAALAFENISYRAKVRALNEELRKQLKERESELASAKETVRTFRRETKYAYEGILRRGGPMTEALRSVDRAVESEVPVLIEGESGTGKELVARAIHLHGARKEGPFVVVNCSALPETLIESELFGHVRGAFTGAHADQRGQFAAANGGTLFLDEVGDLPLPLQPKLLRALQFGEFVPLGATAPRRSDVRCVCATNRDLSAMMSQGRFREDLFYRIAVFPIRLPPLRERKQDVPFLAEKLLRRIASELGQGPRRLHPRAVAKLVEHDWPGNVRELENVLRRAAIVTPGDLLRPEDIPLEPKVISRAVGTLDSIRRGVPGGLSLREEAAVARVLDRGRITLRDMVSATASSKTTATRDLRRLVAARVIVRRGRTTAAFYELAPRWADEAKAKRTPP
ncbi:MAG: sigma 54-interacting transcriptional regulator [Planctomycetaceae bacterium]|nr:sigma 54-interacting transcriptional regulator [Planctomycetota bacterium]NUN51480.1 sigma 54-interacting transcriptional regulator [Planctomycetaceae bacterium]